MWISLVKQYIQNFLYWKKNCTSGWPHPPTTFLPPAWGPISEIWPPLGLWVEREKIHWPWDITQCQAPVSSSRFEQLVLSAATFRSAWTRWEQKILLLYLLVIRFTCTTVLIFVLLLFHLSLIDPLQLSLQSTKRRSLRVAAHSWCGIARTSCSD